MTKSRPSIAQESRTRSKSVSGLLYEPLDFVMVRTPLLPIEAYLALSDQVLTCSGGTTQNFIV